MSANGAVSIQLLIVALFDSVSTLSIFGLASQLELIPAANAAGVKLFLPSEFGLKFAEGPNAVKITVRDLFKTVDLPSTLVFTGLFADIFQHSMGYNYAEDHIRVVGQGNTAFSLTSRTDIARFVAQALTTSSPANLEWAELSIEGDRKTPLEIKAIAEKTLGKPFQTRFVDYEQNAEAAASGDFIACLSKVLEDGNAVAGSADKVKETVAKLFPDRNPSPIEAYIQYNHVHWT